MNTDQKPNNKLVAFTEALDAAKEKFIQIAPKGLDYTAEYSFAVQLLNNNDYLRNVAMSNPLSLQAAIINVAAIGLSLNPAKKQAYLIPRNVKQGGKWVSKIFLEASYIGMCDLATMTGSIQWVQAQTVRQNDTYAENGPGNKPTHVFNPFDPVEKRGPLIGVYCCAKTASGDHLTTAMSIDEVYGIRNRSETWKRKVENEAKGEKGFGGPWETDFEEQTKKTVIRRAWKLWPHTESTERMALAVDLGNEAEGFEPILTSPQLGQYTADQKSYLDQLIQKPDPVEMLLFTKSLDESVFTNLYHSFEKGMKGKYQGIIDAQCKEGHEILNRIVEAVDGHASSGDDAAVLEELTGLSTAAVAWVCGNANAETGEIIRLLQRGQEQEA